MNRGMARIVRLLAGFSLIVFLAGCVPEGRPDPQPASVTQAVVRVYRPGKGRVTVNGREPAWQTDPVSVQEDAGQAYVYRDEEALDLVLEYEVTGEDRFLCYHVYEDFQEPNPVYEESRIDFEHGSNPLELEVRELTLNVEIMTGIPDDVLPCPSAFGRASAEIPKLLLHRVN